MRLFTAIDLTDDVLLRLERLLNALRPEALINWSPLDNLHITLKFIGEWPENRYDELHKAIGSLIPREPFEVELKELGWFPNARSPRVLWAGVHGSEPLAKLAYETEERLSPLGIPKEERPFSPHLTLARIKHSVPLDTLRHKIQELHAASFGTVQVSAFTLFRSNPGSNASIYRKLQTYSFKAAAAAS